MDRPVGGRGAHDPLAAVDAGHRHRTHHQQYEHSSQHDPPPLGNIALPISYHPAVGTAVSADSASYKQLKEAWIADQTGSSIHSINALGLVMLLTYAVWAVLRAKRIRFVRAQHRRPPRELATLASISTATASLSDWQLEFLILIVPAVSAHTVLATHLIATNCVLLAVLAFLIRSGPPLPGHLRPNKDKRQKRHWSKKESDDDSADEDHKASVPSDSTDTIAAEADLPFRVSVDSAADAAHAAAAPPTFYDGPGSPLRLDTELSLDTAIDTASRSPNPGSSTSATSSRNTDASLLSPAGASTSASSSPKRAELTALRTTAIQQPHSRDGSDAQSLASASSTLSPLARSVVDPLGKARQQSSLDHSTSSIDDSSARRGPTRTSSSTPSSTTMDRNLFVRPQPFLTVYRAHMMLVTIISILAVDFPVFPRFLSKCESFGTSWMDMGVGSFVFSLGIISALPFLKSPRNRFRPLKQQLLSDFRKALPLLVLGSVRVVMVKGVEYPEHLSEYGVHWNFFITLSVLPFAATLSRPFARVIRYSLLGLALTLSHQTLLKLTQWQEWALSDTIPRTTLASQNKEGLTSMVGYLAIFYIGLDLGHYVLPLDPYFAYRKLRRRRTRPRTDKLAMVLGSLAVLWWAAYAMTGAVGLRTSRRLANLPYVLWVVAFNTSFLLAYVLVYLWVLQPAEGQDGVTPGLLEDVNRHSLTVFLVANLLTGLVNVTVRTMYTSDAVAVGILLVYTGVCCGLAREMSRRGIRLRL
ncbi:GWT1 [Kalmanozyma brasiliensis GHG001]|uniref:GWT1 n=1 Tax=Kalmanozyma brasiliensis (strain GHG001) TaxID=1365824 RepID=UPI002867D6F3|nr:GWT1 [Kalmanozyma brasiliensis GHG001]KAF6767261.1 GWT1 [Kalmanozyma brasiliensis GHG001]